MTPAFFWAIAGLTLCLMELFIPSAFTESALGLSALVVALLARFIPIFWLQVALWLLLSGAFLLAFRRLSRGRRRIDHTLNDSEAKTLTTIPPGRTGRVMYEGTLWPAQSADPEQAIAANQTVQVVQRKGNLLIVLSNELLL